MDYTTGNSYVTDGGTGNRMHLQAQAIPTAVSDTDLNGLTWELLSVIRGAGITPLAFDKTNPATYSQVYSAVQTLVANAVTANTGNGLKTPVRFTTTGNVALSGLGTQAGGDWGVALTAGDRILPKGQTTGSQNGIYIAAAGSWARATDADGVGELLPGALVTVQEGVSLADSVWELSTDGPITIGTTSLTFARKGDPIFSSAAENAAGVIEGKSVDPLGIREALNAAGTAPIFACRAWVNFNGTATPTIVASGNVSSLTDNGVGDYTVNFSTPMPDAAYSLAGFATSMDTSAAHQWGTVTSRQSADHLAGSVRITVATGFNATTYDANLVTLTVFR